MVEYIVGGQTESMQCITHLAIQTNRTGKIVDSSRQIRSLQTDCTHSFPNDPFERLA